MVLHNLDLELCLDGSFSDGEGLSLDSGKAKAECDGAQSHKGQHGAPQAVVAKVRLQHDGEA